MSGDCPSAITSMDSSTGGIAASFISKEQVQYQANMKNLNPGLISELRLADTERTVRMYMRL